MLGLRRSAQLVAVVAAATRPPQVAACICRAFASTTAAAGEGATRASTASATPSAASSLLTPRSLQAEKNAEARVRSIFYDPSIQLTKRQKQVYTVLDDEPPLPLMEDHGYLYHTSSNQLEGRSELVKRALSTRTANVKAMMQFRRSELLRKYAPKKYDTGCNRVQVAMVTERISRMSAHLSRNKKDKCSKRALTMYTVRRRKILEYMLRKDYTNYRLMVRELNLRPVAIFNSRHLPKERAETHKQVKERHRRLKNRSSRGHKGH